MKSDPRVDTLIDLFETNYESVYRFARRSVDASTAEDIAQDVFARLLRLPDLAGREIKPAYLIKIAENLIRRRFNNDRRFARNAPRIAAERVEPPAPGRVESRKESAGRAVAGLEDKEREAVELVVCRGLSYRQAAASMGAKVTDINNWRYRGVERLRRYAEEAAYDQAE